MKKLLNVSILFVSLLGLPSISQATIVVPLDIVQSGTITDLNFGITYSGSFPQNIDIVLEHDGTQVHIYDATEDVSAAFSALFDDESLNGFAPKDADVLGDFLPDNPLSAFDGMELAGTWNLMLTDNICVCGDDTVLESWGIGVTLSGSDQLLIFGDGDAGINLDPYAVPEPGMLALFSIGLLGLRKKLVKR